MRFCDYFRVFFPIPGAQSFLSYVSAVNMSETVRLNPAIMDSLRKRAGFVTEAGLSQLVRCRDVIEFCMYPLESGMGSDNKNKTEPERGKTGNKYWCNGEEIFV